MIEDNKKTLWPDQAEVAIQLVLEQAQALGEEWSHQGAEA